MPAGGNHRDLYAHYRVGPGLPRYGLVWTKDSRSLFFAMSGESDSQTRIMRISSEGGTPEFTGLTIGGLSTFDVSPDGSRIAYSTNRRVLSSANGVYAIDNLPALLNGAK